MTGVSPSDRPSAPQVLIADDHPLYCDALQAVVAQAFPGAAIRQAESQEAVLAAVKGMGVLDLILLDLNLPGAVGMSCLHRLKRCVPRTPIAVVSAMGDPKIMQETVMNGASAFIPKSASSQVLVHALKVVIAGGTYMPVGVVAALRSGDDGHANHELTFRQRRVLELLSTGLSNKRIARELQISEITVKAHVSAIFRKLGVANRTEAGIEARRLLDVGY